MTDMALPSTAPARPSSPPPHAAGSLIGSHRSRATVVIVLLGIVLCLAYAAFSVHHDVTQSGEPSHALLPWLLLGVALLIALGFEFVNGFHDTANAVATVIYTQLAAAERSRSSGRASSTSWACWCRAARSRSASSRCCRSS